MTTLNDPESPIRFTKRSPMLDRIDAEEESDTSLLREALEAGALVLLLFLLLHLLQLPW